MSIDRDSAGRSPRSARDPRSGRKLGLFAPVLLAASALAVFLAGSTWLALYPPVPDDLAGAPNLDDRARHVHIPVGADSIEGWVLAGSGRGAIAVFHGYGRNHTRAWRYAAFLHAAGYSVVAVDFRSSRRERRAPATLGHHELEDAAATIEWIANDRALSREPLALLGESLGGSVALVSAARDARVLAVLADCPFASGRRAMEDTFSYWTRLPGAAAAALGSAAGVALTGEDPGTLDVLRAADSLRATPLFLIHAVKDDRMRPAQANEIAAAAGGKAEVWLIPEGHNEAWRLHRAEYERRALAFFARTLRASRTGRP